MKYEIYALLIIVGAVAALFGQRALLLWMSGCFVGFTLGLMIPSNLIRLKVFGLVLLAAVFIYSIINNKPRTDPATPTFASIVFVVCVFFIIEWVFDIAEGRKSKND